MRNDAAPRSTVIDIGEGGSVDRIIDAKTGMNYIATSSRSPVLQIHCRGAWHAPDRASWNENAGTLVLVYDRAGVTVKVYVLAKANHVVFEIVGITPASEVELVQWGPYLTTIGDVVGDIVGVVRNTDFAIGIQALNPKTIGGSWEDECDEIVAGREIDDRGTYPDLPPELCKASIFRGCVAWPMPFGSVLQAGLVRAATRHDPCGCGMAARAGRGVRCWLHVGHEPCQHGTVIC